MNTLAPLMLIVFLANGVEMIAGFGSTLLALTFGALLFPIEELVAVLVPLNLILSAYIVMRYGGQIHKRMLFKKILPFTLLGMPLGIYLFRYSNELPLGLIFGITVIFLAGFELFRIFRSSSEDSKKPLAVLWGSVVLFIGGIMQGLYASGGPFVVYFTSRSSLNKGQFRSTLSLLWLILNIVLTFSLVNSGKIDSESLQYSAYLLPFVLGGMFVGSKVHHHLSEELFKRGVYILLFFAGFSLVYKNIHH